MICEVGTGFAYSTIQAAITACPNGGTVRANATAGNAYAEELSISNKRVRLYGGLPEQGISVVGVAGANPALKVSGSGGVTLENLSFSNVGSAATYVVELNVAEDWISRCRIDGNGVMRCLQGQFGDNVLLKNGTHGLAPSCGGQVVIFHFSCVNMTTEGMRANATSGTFQGCLTYNCNSLGFINAGATYSAWNFSDDPTAPGPRSWPGIPLADIAFLDYAGGNFLLSINTRAWVPGISPMALDLLGNRRLRDGRACRITGGCHDPFPPAPDWLSGASQIRQV